MFWPFFWIILFPGLVLSGILCYAVISCCNELDGCHEELRKAAKLRAEIAKLRKGLEE